MMQPQQRADKGLIAPKPKQQAVKPHSELSAKISGQRLSASPTALTLVEVLSHSFC